MKYIEAVEEYQPEVNDISVFFAGGITNCWDWQAALYYNLSKHDETDSLNDLVCLNPRRKNFPIHDPKAAKEQIKWEFNLLDSVDIFSMYFTAGESDQPICMYELGRNILRMQMRFPSDWFKRIIITCEEGYKRVNDVVIQTCLAAGPLFERYVTPVVSYDRNVCINSHAQRIIEAYKYLENKR